MYYDRGNDQHKAILAKMMDGLFPDWRRPQQLHIASRMSKIISEERKCVFINDEGNITYEFQQLVKFYMEGRECLLVFNDLGN